MRVHIHKGRDGVKTGWHVWKKKLKIQVKGEKNVIHYVEPSFT